jgi:hypothetical protein
MGMRGSLSTRSQYRPVSRQKPATSSRAPAANPKTSSGSIGSAWWHQPLAHYFRITPGLRTTRKVSLSEPAEPQATRRLPSKKASLAFGVDPGTLARWERGEREPNGTHIEAVKRFLSGADRQIPGMRRAGYGPRGYEVGRP